MNFAPPVQAIEVFASRLRQGGSVLCADEPQFKAWLKVRGLEVQDLDPAKDLRLAQFGRETYDGIWLSGALSPYSIDDSQRVIATCFKGLKPRTGVLFAAHPYSETGFESLLRQNGFQLLLQGRSGSWIAVVAQRI